MQKKANKEKIQIPDTEACRQDIAQAKKLKPCFYPWWLALISLMFGAGLVALYTQLWVVNQWWIIALIVLILAFALPLGLYTNSRAYIKQYNQFEKARQAVINKHRKLAAE